MYSLKTKTIFYPKIKTSHYFKWTNKHNMPHTTYLEGEKGMELNGLKLFLWNIPSILMFGSLVGRKSRN